MKIELVCEVVRDLLPCYIDGLCTEVTKEAVSEHLAGCAECRILAEKMAADEMCGTASAGDNVIVDSEGDEQLMKKIKSKLNKKIKIVAVCLVAVIALAVGFNLLLNVPLQEVALADVSVDVHSYAMEDLVYVNEGDGSYTVSKNTDIATGDEDVSVSVNEVDDADMDTGVDGSVIYADEDDHSAVVRLAIPDTPNAQVNVTSDVIDKCKDISVVTWSSSYFLRDIRTEVKDGVMYIHGIKTTLLNNKATESSQTMTYLEMGKINKVVYAHADGTEEVLWTGGAENESAEQPSSKTVSKVHREK